MYKEFSWEKLMEDLTQDKETLNIMESDPTESYIKNVMQSHIDSINNNNVAGPSYSEDFRGEDPVGTKPINTGGGDMISELKEVFDVPFIPKKAELTSPITTSFGNSGAMSFKLYVEVDGQDITIDIIDIFKFNHKGEVIEQMAYWGKENVTIIKGKSEQ